MSGCKILNFLKTLQRLSHPHSLRNYRHSLQWHFRRAYTSSSFKLVWQVFIGYTGKGTQLLAFLKKLFEQLKLVSPGFHAWKLIPDLVQTGLSNTIGDRDGIFTSSLTDYGGV